MPQVSRDGGITSPATEGRGGSDAVEGGRTALDNKTSLLNTQPPRAFPGPRARDYSPYPYSDTISTYDKTALKEAVFDDDMEQLRDGLSLPVPLPPSHPTPTPTSPPPHPPTRAAPGTRGWTGGLLCSVVCAPGRGGTQRTHGEGLARNHDPGGGESGAWVQPPVCAFPSHAVAGRPGALLGDFPLLSQQHLSQVSRAACVTFSPVGGEGI